MIRSERVDGIRVDDGIGGIAYERPAEVINVEAHNFTTLAGSLVTALLPCER